MSPRKSRDGVPQWVVDIKFKMKRKKLALGPYDCPKCGRDKLRIRVDRQKKEVMAICECGTYPLEYATSYEPIDYYNKLVDKFHKKK